VLSNMNSKLLLKIATYTTFATAILHLALTQTQVSALLLLTNQICGIYMFAFVLLGLVCLFNTLRTKSTQGRTFYTSLALFIVTLVFGGMLVKIYFDSIANQPSINAATVYSAIYLSLAVMFCYFASFVLFIIAKIYDMKHKEIKEVIIENKVKTCGK